MPLYRTSVFGGVDGLVWIDPQNDRQESYSPDLHFFELKMGDETISLYDYADANPPVTIPPDVSTLPFHLLPPTISMVTIMNILICCKIIIRPGRNYKRAMKYRFTKLPYGNYTLKVRYKTMFTILMRGNIFYR